MATTIELQDQAETVLSLRCRDMGTADCDYVATGNTEEEVLQNGFAHASKEHVVAVTLTNIGGDNFFLKQFAIGGETSRTGMAPLTASVLDSDYSRGLGKHSKTRDESANNNKSR